MNNTSRRIIQSTSKWQAILEFLLRLKCGPGCSKQPLEYHCTSKHYCGSC